MREGAPGATYRATRGGLEPPISSLHWAMAERFNGSRHPEDRSACRHFGGEPTTGPRIERRGEGAVVPGIAHLVVGLSCCCGWLSDPFPPSDMGGRCDRESHGRRACVCRPSASRGNRQLQTAFVGGLSNSSYPISLRRSVPYCASPPKALTPAPLATLPKRIEHCPPVLIVLQ